MYYKIVSDGMIVDALNSLECCKYVSKVKRVLRCKIDEDPCGIISWQGIIWHVEGWPEFPEGTEDIAGTVTYSEIDEEEYTALYEAIASGLEVEDEEEEEEVSEEEQSSLEYIRSAKITEMSKTCNSVIAAGFTVTLSDGLEHTFTLSDEDQANMTSLLLMVANGETAIPYHANGELCVFYSVADIMIITTAGTSLKTYHTTYFNSLKAWINSMTTIAEISAVAYGDDIPIEYQSEVLQVLLASMSTAAETDSGTEAAEE